MQDKVVIITGGTSGIGLACAKIFGKICAKIVITGRNKSTLLSTQKILENLGINVFPIEADVSSMVDCKRVINETVAQFGRIDILINNAGISMRATFAQLDLEVMHRLMNTNFWGTVYMTKYAMEHIKKTKGSIIGISSIAGYRGLPARTGYSASKFAMHGFLESLRTELIPDGVHVLIACPGYTTSNIRNTALNANGSPQGETPLDESQLMSADGVAAAIVKATISRKKIIILTRLGKLTVWLNKLFPEWMDQLVFNKIKKEKDSPL